MSDSTCNSFLDVVMILVCMFLLLGLSKHAASSKVFSPSPFELQANGVGTGVNQAVCKLSMTLPVLDHSALSTDKSLQFHPIVALNKNVDLWVDIEGNAFLLDTINPILSKSKSVLLIGVAKVKIKVAHVSASNQAKRLFTPKVGLRRNADIAHKGITTITVEMELDPAIATAGHDALQIRSWVEIDNAGRQAPRSLVEYVLSTPESGAAAPKAFAQAEAQFGVEQHASGFNEAYHCELADGSQLYVMVPGFLDSTNQVDQLDRICELVGTDNVTPVATLMQWKDGLDRVLVQHRRLQPKANPHGKKMQMMTLNHSDIVSGQVRSPGLEDLLKQYAHDKLNRSDLPKQHPWVCSQLLQIEGKAKMLEVFEVKEGKHYHDFSISAASSLYVYLIASPGVDAKYWQASDSDLKPSATTSWKSYATRSAIIPAGKDRKIDAQPHQNQLVEMYGKAVRISVDAPAGANGTLVVAEYNGSTKKYEDSLISSSFQAEVKPIPNFSVAVQARFPLPSSGSEPVYETKVEVMR